MTLRHALVLAFVLPAVAFAQGASDTAPGKEKAPGQQKKDGKDASAGKWTKRAADGKDIFVTMKTTQGDIVLKLFPKDAPKTVQNFVALAAGEKEWTDPATGQVTKRPLYDGTIFHRVIPNFMIQGGDPLGRGIGGPGYKFEDEFQSGRKFDKEGLLAMANAGPNTNGSQFFITTTKPEWLTGKHTIFGEVVSGYDVVVAIGNAPRGQADRPNTEIKIEKVELSDKAPKGAKPAAAPKK